MSPNQDRSTLQRNQLQDNRQKAKRRGRQPRSRQCLLKGCGKSFRPGHPMARYCSEECRRNARQWSQWKSRQRWRQSENGRKKRKQQSVRRRERLQIAGRASSRPENGGRGSSQAASQEFFLAIPVIVPAATRDLSETVVRRCSDSAATAAGAR